MILVIMVTAPMQIYIPFLNGAGSSLKPGPDSSEEHLFLRGLEVFHYCFLSKNKTL
jgi:hypothetical protein